MEISFPSPSQRLLFSFRWSRGHDHSTQATWHLVAGSTVQLAMPNSLQSSLASLLLSHTHIHPLHQKNPVILVKPTLQLLPATSMAGTDNSTANSRLDACNQPLTGPYFLFLP